MSKQPIDKGWAWMVCLGTAVQAFFVIGGLKCMGILFVEIVEIFNAPHSVSSITLGLVAGGFAIFAMMSNALSVILGMRTVTIIGGFSFALSLFLSMFPINIWYIVIMLGFVGGLALGAMLTPAVMLLNTYFDKRRAFSNGLAMAGSSIGQLILPYLMTFLIREYGYQGAMLIYSGIALHTIPAAMLLRPVAFWDRKDKIRNRKTKTKEVLDGKSLLSVPQVIRSNTLSIPQNHSNSDLRGSQASVLRSAALSLVPGASVESLDVIHKQQDIPEISEKSSWKVCHVQIKRISPKIFCGLIFDKDLLRSPCLWLLFFSLGLGHSGFITALLFLPSLAVEIFHDKSKGALLMTIVGLFDLCGRVGGGWFADQGFITRIRIILIGFSSCGLATFLMALHPILPTIIAYCVVMGLLGGLYRILIPVIVGDLFGRHKTGPGVGMLFMSLGLLIVPIPPLSGYMRQVFGNYIPSLHFCGGMLFLGALLIGLLDIVKKYDKSVIKPQNTPAIATTDMDSKTQEESSTDVNNQESNA